MSKIIFLWAADVHICPVKPGIGQNGFPDRHTFDDIIDFTSRTKDKAITERGSFVMNESMKSGRKML